MTAAQIAGDIASAIGSNCILFGLVLIACLVSRKSKTVGVILYILGVAFQTLSIVGQVKILNGLKGKNSFVYGNDALQFRNAQFRNALIVSIIIALIGIIIIATAKKKPSQITSQTNTSNYYIVSANSSASTESAKETFQQEIPYIDMAGTNEVTTKFECKRCKVRFSEKYYECPVCHAINSIDILSIDNGDKTNSPLFDLGGKDKKYQLIDRNKAAPSYCSNCSAKLDEGSSFCGKCGTPSIPLTIEEGGAESHVQVMPPIDLPKVETEDSVFEIDLLDKKLHPKVRRAYIYAEDAEWDKADACLEAVLDENPTDAYAYVVKLLIDYKVSKTADIRLFAGTLTGNKNFQRALRFADDDLARKLKDLR